VCLCVCLSVCEDISGTIRAIFTIFVCCVFTVAQSSSDRVKNSRERGNFKGFLPIDYALYNIAFGAHNRK